VICSVDERYVEMRSLERTRRCYAAKPAADDYDARSHRAA
jgi:hypothetical protein